MFFKLSMKNLLWFVITLQSKVNNSIWTILNISRSKEWLNIGVGVIRSSERDSRTVFIPVYLIT